MKLSFLLAALVVVTLFANTIASASKPRRILFSPLPNLVGHASSLAALAHELSQRPDSNLEIYFVNTAPLKKLVEKNPNITFLPIDVAYNETDLHIWSIRKFPQVISSAWRLCDNLLAESYKSLYHVIKKLADEGKKPDLIIGDHLSPPTWLAAHSFDIPYFRIYNSYYFPYDAPLWAPAGSFVFKFAKPLLGLVSSLYARATLHYHFHPIQRQLGVPEGTVGQFFGSDAGVTFLPTVYGMDHAYPLPSSFVQVGPMIQLGSMKMEENLEEWFASQQNDVIYIGFGSMHDLSEDLLNKIVDAVRQLDNPVLWSLREKQQKLLRSPLPSNLMIAPWVNQHAVLNHGKVKLFVSHCGFNGLAESMYFGKPLICIPLAAEQPINAVRVQSMDLGSHLNKDKVSSQDIHREILQVLNSETINQNVQRVKTLIKLAGGTARAADLVLAFLETGTQHLKSADKALSWFQVNNLDVAAVLIAVALACYHITTKIFKCCCCRKQKKD